jgi:methanogenic corrinoid protein MtbC1
VRSTNPEEIIKRKLKKMMSPTGVSQEGNKIIKREIMMSTKIKMTET